MKAIVIHEELALLTRDGAFIGYVHPDGEIIQAMALEIVLPIRGEGVVYDITADEILHAMGAE